MEEQLETIRKTFLCRTDRKSTEKQQKYELAQVCLEKKVANSTFEKAGLSVPLVVQPISVSASEAVVHHLHKIHRHKCVLHCSSHSRQFLSLQMVLVR